MHTDEPWDPSRPAPKRQHNAGKWKRHARRLRDEAGLHVIRGAATAVGTAAATFSIIWLHSHI